MVLFDCDLIKNGGNTNCHIVTECFFDVSRHWTPSQCRSLPNAFSMSAVTERLLNVGRHWMPFRCQPSPWPNSMVLWSRSRQSRNANTLLDKYGRWQRLFRNRELVSHHVVHALWWFRRCKRAKVVRCHLVMCKKHILPRHPPLHHIDKWWRCDDAKVEVLFDLVADFILDVLHFLKHGSEERINMIRLKSRCGNDVRVSVLNLRAN